MIRRGVANFMFKKVDMIKFPIFSKRKVDTIANGVFLVLLGILFYTNQWWPGILFALGLTFAIRQYLRGRRLNFLIILTLIALLAVLTLAGQVFSLLFPFIFIGIGLYLIAKECFPRREFLNKDQSSNSQDFKK